MPNRFLAIPILLAVLAAAAVGAGPAAAPPSPAAAPSGGGAPAALPAPGKAKVPVRFRKGTLSKVDLEAGTLAVRVPGGEGDEEYPAGGTVPLGSLREGDNVVVTVKGGTAVSVRPFRSVPKSLRALPPHKVWKVIEKPAAPPGGAPPRPAPPQN